MIEGRKMHELERGTAQSCNPNPIPPYSLGKLQKLPGHALSWVWQSDMSSALMTHCKADAADVLQGRLLY